MKEYKLLTSDNSITLGEIVSEHLKAGWELYGSPMVCMCTTGTYTRNVQFSQAVFKK